MKYRIKLVRYADEREEFYVEAKGLMSWSVVHTLECFDDWVPRKFASFEEAKDYILDQVDTNLKKKIVSTEIVFEIGDN